jgi:hypothetical protein
MFILLKAQLENFLSARSYIFPLYYQEPTAFDERERIPNFNPKILAEIEAKLGMKCVDDENFGKENFSKRTSAS